MGIVKGKLATDYPHTIQNIPAAMTLEHMFKDGERFEKLMTFMFKEFNYEIGLFMIEIIQFKRYMVRHLIQTGTERANVDGDTEQSMASVNTSTNRMIQYQRYL